MKKAISLLLSVLMITTIFAVLPVTANAAETDSSAVGNAVSGETGDCVWTYDNSSATLTISGEGSAGDDWAIPGSQPWAQYNEDIYHVVVEDGVTYIGECFFYGMNRVYDATLADSVTYLGVSAFDACKNLTKISLGANIATISSDAFLNTNLTAISIPNPDCTIRDHAFGYDMIRNRYMPRTDFFVYGYGESTAKVYADNNNFDYVDLSGKKYDISVIYPAYIVNLATGEQVFEAYEGEWLQARINLDKYENLDSFYGNNDTVQFDEQWRFIMPDEDIRIWAETWDSEMLLFDLSDGQEWISEEEYSFLIDLSFLGYITLKDTDVAYQYTVDLDYNGSDDILLKSYEMTVLETNSVKSAICKEPKGKKYNPVVFAFVSNLIYRADVELTVPHGGDPWDWETMSANVKPADDDSHMFTVTQSYWYTEYGLSAFNEFEGGEKYFAGMYLAPKEGYAFLPTTNIVVHADTDREDYHYSNRPYMMNDDGSLYFSTQNFIVKGGDPHSITVYRGFVTPVASDSYGEDAVDTAIPGDYLHLRATLDNPEEHRYIVLGSEKAISSEADVYEQERIGWWAMYMPNRDVTVEFQYETAEQKDIVLDLNNGPAGFEGAATQYSDVFGINAVLRNGVDYEYTEEGVLYDIDGNGSWDMKGSGGTYSLLPTSSLTANTSVSIDNSKYPYSPVNTVIIQVKAPVKHKITVSGGVATSVEDDRANNFVITEAYEGDYVYIEPKASDIADDEYVAQFSTRAESDDVEFFEEAGISFIMPDHDVSITYYYDSYTQDISVFDFRYQNTVTVEYDGTAYARSEAYGVSMVLRLLSKTCHTEYIDELDTMFYLYDIDGDGTYDIEQDPDNNIYKLLDTNSLPENGINLTLSREQSWTLPIRTLVINVPQTIIPAKHGDVNFDGEITIEDASIIQRHLAHFLNPNNGPLIDEEDPDWFFRADANNDGKINIKDVTAIQRHLAGYEELPQD